jgi:signal transduction histidine kinase
MAVAQTDLLYDEDDRQLIITAERDRILQDLHDTVAHRIAGLTFRLGACASEASTPALRSLFEKLRSISAECNDSIRRTIDGIAFEEVLTKGLVAALGALAGEFEICMGVPVKFQIEGKLTPLSSDKEITLYRTAQQALANVERHARASNVMVTLSYGQDAVTVSIRDDGVGLSRGALTKTGHYGVSGMRARLEELCGSLQIKRANPGLLVEGRIPMS